MEDWNLRALHGGNANGDVIVVEADHPPDPPPPPQPEAEAPSSPAPAPGVAAAGPHLYGHRWRHIYINATRGILPYGVPNPARLRHVLIDLCQDLNADWYCTEC